MHILCIFNLIIDILVEGHILKTGITFDSLIRLKIPVHNSKIILVENLINFT